MSDGQGSLFVGRIVGNLRVYEPVAPGDPVGRVALPPIARNSDPLQSKLAAAEHTESGSRERQMALILAAVRRSPGLTYRELHARMGGAIEEPVQVEKRCSDLVEAGKIKRGERRRCTVSRRPAQTWWPNAAA
jgi:hypothetical protein